jgi:hypothetical protein
MMHGPTIVDLRRTDQPHDRSGHQTPMLVLTSLEVNRKWQSCSCRQEFLLAPTAPQAALHWRIRFVLL